MGLCGLDASDHADFKGSCCTLHCIQCQFMKKFVNLQQDLHGFVVLCK